MQFKEVIYSIGDIFTWTFGLLTEAQNIPNILFSAIIAFFFLYWMREMAGHAKAGEK
jgi:hypothetical protein